MTEPPPLQSLPAEGGGMPRAVVLAGGRGTRLLPYTLTFPKPLVPLGDMPILEILLRRLHRSGIRRVTLAVGHLSALIRAFIAQHSSGTLAELEIDFVEETEARGTAGALSLVPGLDETFLVMNGDLLTNLDFKALLAHHYASGAALTIAGYTKRVQIDLGVMDLSPEGALLGYREKPVREYPVSMGIYVYEPGVLDLIPRQGYLDFPDLVHRLLERGELVVAYPFQGLWLDIGRPEDYAEAQRLFQARREEFLAE